MRVAGREEKLFEDAAVARIAAATAGTPRKINILCVTALVYGFSQEAALIGPEIIEEVLRDKARFGVLGANASQLSPMALTEVGQEPHVRGSGDLFGIRDDQAARAMLAAMFDRKK